MSDDEARSLRKARNTASLHGESAARRQAVTELLFFCSIGDLGRIKKICDTWNIEARARDVT